MTEYKAFVVEQYGRPIGEFNTIDEACAYIEKNQVSHAEVYDCKGDLVCFYR